MLLVNDGGAGPVYSSFRAEASNRAHYVSIMYYVRDKRVTENLLMGRAQARELYNLLGTFLHEPTRKRLRKRSRTPALRRHMLDPIGSA